MGFKKQRLNNSVPIGLLC